MKKKIWWTILTIGLMSALLIGHISAQEEMEIGRILPDKLKEDNVLNFVLEKLITRTTDNLPTKHIIKNVSYIPMYDYWATCAITALEMQLKYFGVDYPHSILMNIDWAYGTGYSNSPFNKILCVNSESIDTILYTAKIIGCSITEINNQKKEKAWETLKGYLAQNIPVIIQWTGHTVLAVGYDESPTLSKPLVIYHNPRSPAKFLESEGYNSTLGAYASMPLDQWMTPSYWGHHRFSPKKFEMIIVKPPKNEVAIPWDEVMVKNAEKTLGLGEWAPNPPYYWSGYEATRKLAEDIEAGRMTFQNMAKMRIWTTAAPAQRSHASAFLAGFSELTLIDSKYLKKSSEYFELASYKWHEVNAFWNYAQDHPNKFQEDAFMKKLAEAFRQISDYEKIAGRALLKGAKVLTTNKGVRRKI